MINQEFFAEINKFLIEQGFNVFRPNFYYRRKGENIIWITSLNWSLNTGIIDFMFYDSVIDFESILFKCLKEKLFRLTTVNWQNSNFDNTVFEVSKETIVPAVDYFKLRYESLMKERDELDLIKYLESTLFHKNDTLKWKWNGKNKVLRKMIFAKKYSKDNYGKIVDEAILNYNDAIALQSDKIGKAPYLLDYLKSINSRIGRVDLLLSILNDSENDNLIDQLRNQYLKNFEKV